MITVVFVGIAVLAVLWIAGPLMSDEPVAAAPSAAPQGDRAGNVLDQIADLDLEHAAGKIPDKAYQYVRADLAAQAVLALEKDPEASDGLPATSATGAQALLSGEPAPVEHKRTSAAFCPGCGKPSKPRDKFCAHCGHKLK